MTFFLRLKIFICLFKLIKGSTSTNSSDEALSELSDSDGDSSTISDDKCTTNNRTENPILTGSNSQPNISFQNINNENAANPPLLACSLKDKLNNWLKDPTSPITPQEDPIEENIPSTSFANNLETKVTN